MAHNYATSTMPGLMPGSTARSGSTYRGERRRNTIHLKKILRKLEQKKAKA